MTAADAVVEIESLRISYPDRRRRSVDRHRRVEAVRGVTLTLRRGESLGLVGESGSGKSTLARALVGIVSADSGHIMLDGLDLSTLRSHDPRAAARRIQMVFQDSLGALDPRQRIGDALSEVLTVHRLAVDQEVPLRVRELLEMVGMGPEHASRFPHQLSGGQLQRVGIARALAVEPDVLVLDEPVSALDVSVQARILRLLDTLRRSLGISVVFIAHDLGVVRNVCNRIAVMYRGQLVEVGSPELLFVSPRHPYTRDLLAAVPRLET